MKWCKGIGAEVDIESGRKWRRMRVGMVENGGKCWKKAAENGVEWRKVDC